MLCAIRGAIQVAHDQPEAIHEATGTLVRTMLDWNQLTADDVISMLFTMTTDLRSAFPAAGARAAGLREVPMMCAAEIAVPDGLPRVIRLMTHAETPRLRSQIRHVYL